jgi:phage terminase large subunit-like protein
MAKVRQGYATLTSPTKKLLELVVSKKLRHGGNPVLRWMADNVMAVHDPAGNVKLDKGKATGRIDGIAAMINAIERADSRQSEQPSALAVVDIEW